MIRYLALATDYDGTLARAGKVDEATIDAMKRLLDSGRKLILVTGRDLVDLQRVFDRLDLFELVVAENGALLYSPATREETPLAEAPPEAFIQYLRMKNVTPLSVGRVIVATWEPNETAVLEGIQALGLDWQIIFNKGAVMVLPAGMNKAAGLTAALERMKISPHSIAGIGDAENDHALLSACGASAAVANALPLVKERADFVSAFDHGAGVVDFIDRMLEDDLASVPSIGRHALLLGKLAGGGDLTISAHGPNVLVAGGSGSGKSTITRGLLERISAAGYQYCLVDPEGDYEFDGVVRVGDPEHAADEATVLQILEDPRQNAIVNLLGVALADRPAFFARLLPQLQQLRGRTGHPHWLVIDEAHHLLPQSWLPAQGILPHDISGVLMITVHPEWVAPAMLSAVDVMIGVGDAGADAVRACAEALQEDVPDIPSPERDGTAVAWLRRDGGQALCFVPEPATSDQHRHKRKYAQGELPEEISFYFRGPGDKLNLRAHNLVIFAQIAEGVDETTWAFHLDNGDYARWFTETIKDEELAAVAEQIRREQLPPAESRRRLLGAIRERYTAPAAAP